MFDEEKLEKALLDTAIREAFKGYDRTLTGAAAAKDCVTRLHGALAKVSQDFGQNPKIEVDKWEPKDHNYRGKWGAGWEAGPYEWAIAASFTIMDLTGRLCEPHHSFDLCFYEVE